MGHLDGRVAIVTGAGRGIGRAHALALAAEGASVVVNDLGADLRGDGADATPAGETVEEIRASGGVAVVSGHDVGDWQAAAAMVRVALDTFGRLDVLVNNAGILRDRSLANMDENEWDAVIRVHLKGHAAPTRHAMAYWRERAKAGEQVAASVIHTTSLAGLVGTFGQANYASAKLAVVGLSRVAAIEGARYGVRSNAVSPSARSRIEPTLGAGAEGFDVFDPANVSPLICWLARADCPATGQVFQAYGDRVEVIAPTAVAVDLRAGDRRWTSDGLDEALRGRLPAPASLHDFVDGLGER